MGFLLTWLLVNETSDRWDLKQDAHFHVIQSTPICSQRGSIKEKQQFHGAEQPCAKRPPWFAPSRVFSVCFSIKGI